MWDQRYGGHGFAYGTDPNVFLRQSTPLLPPTGRILCLAEGEGRNGVYLAERGYEVDCVDSSRVGLEKAAQLARSRSVTINTVVADLQTYHFEPDHYDGIISIFCHLPPSLRQSVHRQVYKSLRPRGVFILEGYSKKQIENNTGGPRNPDMLMDVDTVCRELEHLHIDSAEEKDRYIEEGTYHLGNGSVIQLIGVKR